MITMEFSFNTINIKETRMITMEFSFNTINIKETRLITMEFSFYAINNKETIMITMAMTIYEHEMLNNNISSCTRILFLVRVTIQLRLKILTTDYAGLGKVRQGNNDIFRL